MEVYRNTEGPFTKTDFEVSVKLDHETIPEFTTYRHCNLPLMGISEHGPTKPFLYFDDLLDLSKLDEINSEVVSGEKKGLIDFKRIVANGVMPTEINGQKSIDSYIEHLKKYAPDQSWEKSIQALSRKGDIKVFFHEYFKLKVAWEGIAMFRKYTGRYEDKSLPSDWLPLADQFPLLKNFVDALPFEYVGYVMIFKTNGKNPVLIHRDYYPTNHNVNFINFRLSDKPRPFFLYDCLTHEKNYISKQHRSYFFNEIDAHGMDQENTSGLTLRVEGRFNKELRHKIGLNNNDTFNWDFSHVKDFLSSGKFIIEKSTDI